MAFKNATKAYLDGLTAGTADIDALAVTGAKISAGAIISTKLGAGVVTSDKLSKPYSLQTLTWNIPNGLGNTFSSTKGLGVQHFQMYGAGTIVEIGVACRTMPTSGAPGIQVAKATTSGAYTNILATSLMCAAVFKPAVAAPSGTLGTMADNKFLRVSVTKCGSGTSSLSGWIVLKQYGVA